MTDDDPDDFWHNPAPPLPEHNLAELATSMPSVMVKIRLTDDVAKRAAEIIAEIDRTRQEEGAGGAAGSFLLACPPDSPPPLPLL